MITSIIALIAGLAMGDVGAKEHRVFEVQPLGEIICNFHNEGSSLPSTKLCSDFKPPAKVAIGESFSAEGLRRVIRVVFATQVEQDYADPNIKKGEWFCMAAETADDLGENQPHRVWLFIPRCAPVL
jgi:hypothetical protein